MYVHGHGSYYFFQTNLLKKKHWVMIYVNRKHVSDHISHLREWEEIGKYSPPRSWVGRTWAFLFSEGRGQSSLGRQIYQYCCSKFIFAGLYVRKIHQRIISLMPFSVGAIMSSRPICRSYLNVNLDSWEVPILLNNMSFLPWNWASKFLAWQVFLKYQHVFLCFICFHCFALFS